MWLIECSNCEAVYLGESKRSLKSRSNEQKRSVRNCDCDKNDTANHCWEAVHNLTGIRGKLLDREGRLISRKTKETINFWKNPNQIFKKFPTCFLKYIFLIYSSSWLLIYVTSVNFNWWHLPKPITFASVKVYCLINLICLIILISHTAQLLLIRMFYFFRPGRHISLNMRNIIIYLPDDGNSFSRNVL